MYVHFFQKPKLLLAISICFFAQSVHGQSFFKLEKAMRFWVLKHPFAAIKAKTISKSTLHMVDSLKKSMVLDTFLSGGRLDAFRHIFWMCQLTEMIGPKKARSLGKAHEFANYQQFLNRKKEDGDRPDSLSSVMDLLNNEIGIHIAQNDSSEIGLIIPYIIGIILNGNATILKRQSNAYISCDFQHIDPILYKDKWFIPYCLVRSSE